MKLIGLLLLPSLLFAQVTSVLVTDESARLKKTLLPTTVLTSNGIGFNYVDSLKKQQLRWNSAWNNVLQQAFIKAARNETAGFQVFPFTGNSPATNVYVKLDSLHKASSPSYTIKSRITGYTQAQSDSAYRADLFDERGRRIRWYVEQYTDVISTERTNATYIGWVQPGGVANSGTHDSVWVHPDIFRGLQPEYLVPAEATSKQYPNGGGAGNGQGGYPVTLIPANQNQGFFCEVEVPKDAPAGNYTGTIKVYEQIGAAPNTLTYSIPITLEVFDFTLSDTTHLPATGLISRSNIDIKHSVLSTGNADSTVLLNYIRYLHKRRVEAQFPMDTTFFNALGRRFCDGSQFTYARKYDGFGSNTPIRILHVGGYTEPSFYPGSETDNYNNRGWQKWGGNMNALVDRGTWTTATAYNKNDLIHDDDWPFLFVCDSAHTSSASTQPQEGASWRLPWLGLYERSWQMSFPFYVDTAAYRIGFQSTATYWQRQKVNYFPNTEFYLYRAEEPGHVNGKLDTSAFFDVRRKTLWLRSNPSGFVLKSRGAGRLTSPATDFNKQMNIFYDLIATTNGQFGYGAYTLDTVRAHFALGQKFEGYSGSYPGGPSEVIDAPAAFMRIMGWQYWNWYTSSRRFDDMTGWRINDPPLNMWQRDRVTFGSTIKYGDETLVLAGQDSDFPNDSRGIPGPIGGLRLMNWRAGSQDYEYLYIAKSIGMDTTAIASFVNSLTPKQYTEMANAAHSKPVPPLRAGLTGWAQTGGQINAVKWALAAAIVGTGSLYPTGAIQSDVDTIAYGGGTVSLDWESQNATSATLDIGGVIVHVAIGGDTTLDIAETTEFKLTVNNSLGSASYIVTVYVIDSPGAQGSFSLSPMVLPLGGGNVYLNWEVLYADSAKLVLANGDTINVSMKDGYVDVVARGGTWDWTLLMYDSEGVVSMTASAYVQRHKRFVPFVRP